MILAIPTEDGHIAQQLGKCTLFTLVFAENGSFRKQEYTLSEAGHIAVVSMIAEQKVDVLICGELGLMARSALQMMEITLVPGCTGDIDTAINKFLQGQPQGDPSILDVEIVMDENDPMQCMHDCAKCSGCGGEIPESIRKRIPEL